MVWYFKRSRYLKFFLCIIEIVLLTILIYLVQLNKTAPIIICFGAAFIWAFICAVIPVRYSNRLLSNAILIVLDQCDAKKYLQILDSIINRGIKRGYNISRLFIFRSNALFLEGKVNEAWSDIKSINVFYDNAEGVRDRIYYLGAVFSMYLADDNLDMAGKVLYDMKNTIDNLKYTRALKKSFYNIYKEDISILDVRKQNKGNYELIYIEKFKKADHKLYKVLAEFKLGRIYSESGRYKEAKEAFKYVIQNGNTLHCVLEAKEYLSKMNSDKRG